MEPNIEILVSYKDPLYLVKSYRVLDSTMWIDKNTFEVFIHKIQALPPSLTFPFTLHFLEYNAMINHI